MQYITLYRQQEYLIFSARSISFNSKLIHAFQTWKHNSRILVIGMQAANESRCQRSRVNLAPALRRNIISKRVYCVVIIGSSYIAQTTKYHVSMRFREKIENKKNMNYDIYTNGLYSIQMVLNFQELKRNVFRVPLNCFKVGASFIQSGSSFQSSGAAF